jgi:hypothetical protein
MVRAIVDSGAAAHVLLTDGTVILSERLLMQARARGPVRYDEDNDSMPDLVSIADPNDIVDPATNLEAALAELKRTATAFRAEELVHGFSKTLLVEYTRAFVRLLLAISSSLVLTHSQFRLLTSSNISTLGLKSFS